MRRAQVTHPAPLSRSAFHRSLARGASLYSLQQLLSPQRQRDASWLGNKREGGKRRYETRKEEWGKGREHVERRRRGNELGWGARNVDSSPPLPSCAQRSNGDATAAEEANPPAAKCHSKNSGLRQIDTLETTQEPGCTRALSRATTERLHPHAAYRPMFERGYIRCIHGGGELSLKKNGLRK